MTQNERGKVTAPAPRVMTPRRAALKAQVEAAELAQLEASTGSDSDLGSEGSDEILAQIDAEALNGI